MRQGELPQYQRIILSRPHCVRLLESEQSEDPSYAEMLGLSEDYPLTVVVLVTKCQQKTVFPDIYS